MADNPIRVGILGQGRSGWGIHARIIQTLPERFQVVAVADAIPERLAQSAADLGCTACDSVEEVIANDGVELVIVSTFNHLHAPHAQQALAAGKHVLCEKPFGLTVADVDAMIAAAEKAGRVLAPFQQRRYERDFQKVLEVVQSGVLGEIVHIRICWHGFGRRWDWQTARPYGGGALNNNGPHPLDHAVALFGGDEDPDVWAQAGCYLCSGDAEDHLKIILTGEGHPTVEMELSSVWACPGERWTVCGTRGGLHGNERKLEWKWVDYDAMPPRTLDMNPTPDRTYNSEKIEWQTASWEPQGKVQATGAGAPPPPGSVNLFYDGLYQAIREGKPLYITPESVRRRVAVMDKIRAQSGIKASTA